VITKANWKALGEKARWDVLCALRGPDCPEDMRGWLLKYLTTAIIRNEVWDVLKAQGGSALINKELRVMLMPSSLLSINSFIGQQRPGWSSFNAHHFLTHQLEAANWLGIPVLRFPREVWINAIIPADQGDIDPRKQVKVLNEQLTTPQKAMQADACALVAAYVKGCEL